MACNGISLLVSLLAFFVLASTLARNLDIPGSVNREFSSARSAKKHGPLSSSEGTGHAKGVSVSSTLYHETGHKENTRTLETGDAENIILNDEESFLPILSHSEDILLHNAELFLHDDHTIPSYLAQNGLPIGLLPSSVASYSIKNDGEFIICLQEACYANFDYEVYYAHTITGKLSYGTITHLAGIQAKEAFFWVPVTGVHIDVTSSGYIYFDAGPISKKLPISQFQTVPVCQVKATASSALA